MLSHFNSCYLFSVKKCKLVLLLPAFELSAETVKLRTGTKAFGKRARVHPIALNLPSDSGSWVWSGNRGGFKVWVSVSVMG